ncbi:MAG TPA: DUF4440 domain-containing protein [Vicinamibacterales bacterium]|nr:DUF4440 domain-containing protein [Vicinamibacterales bacterium]
MMRRIAPCLALGFVVSLAACTPPQPAAPVDTRAADEAAIREADAAWSATASTGNLDAMMAFVAADAVMLPPNEPAVSGADAIRQYMERTLAVPGFSLSWQADTVAASGGDLGYSKGTATITVNGPDGTPMTMDEKYLTIWRRQADGSWKVSVDMFNSNTPPPGAGAGAGS